MRKRGISRRRFVEQAASGVAFMIVPAHVLGRGHVPPSDKLNIACIGVGGMGANDVRGVGKTENIYALCDVDERQGAQSFAAFPKAKRYKDFRALLDKEGKSIDAVTVSTPDHTHTVAGMMAMKLGKHTRIQKPLARTLWEVKQLEEAATKYKVATQMGNQGHAEEGTRQIREWVEAGAIGTVREIQLAAGAGPAARGVLHAALDRLGLVARPRARAAVQPRVRAVQMARLVGFRDGRARRHRVSLDGCVVLGARSRLSDADRG